jgi:hypothetical protein
MTAVMAMAVQHRSEGTPIVSDPDSDIIRLWYRVCTGCAAKAHMVPKLSPGAGKTPLYALETRGSLPEGE